MQVSTPLPVLFHGVEPFCILIIDLGRDFDRFRDSQSYGSHMAIHRGLLKSSEGSTVNVAVALSSSDWILAGITSCWVDSEFRVSELRTKP